jgi:large subunit ribosomal protein L6|uniref:Ribosomal protein L6 n=1 Tax=Thorea hispida TaxID=202687 RepID=A0A1C9CAR3_9FLOR|nr:ribosomal protein L6 [Thorea hispida]AOM65471.1 ribosomal protein L6 [Thorea hispida]ARX95840.1 50S ribosomal protein L6 [Thorea hispida]
MSRIGKKSIFIPHEINTTINNNCIVISGPKGKLSYNIPSLIRVDLNNDNRSINIYAINSTKKSKELHGLSRTLIYNMVIGVTQGFNKTLEIQGVGYRCNLDQRKLILNVGYSHSVLINPPKNISIIVNNNFINVSGIDKELVGQVAATIRSTRQPEPYKGKGIKYKNEVVKRKVGKAGK